MKKILLVLLVVCPFLLAACSNETIVKTASGRVIGTSFDSSGRGYIRFRYDCGNFVCTIDNFTFSNSTLYDAVFSKTVNIAENSMRSHKNVLITFRETLFSNYLIQISETE